MPKRRSTVELFEQMRREYEHGEGTIKEVARKFGVHRRMVRQAVASAVPPERKKPVRRRPKLGPVAGFIDAIVHADRNAPRKQRHTAHRIWLRVRQEQPEVTCGESTVRRYVRWRKRELGLAETFIPQRDAWGAEAQVDWYEAWAELGGEPEKVCVFCMPQHGQRRSISPCVSACQSTGIFGGARTGLRLLWWGLPCAARYDNLTSAVKKMLRGR